MELLDAEISEGIDQLKRMYELQESEERLLPQALLHIGLHKK